MTITSLVLGSLAAQVLFLLTKIVFFGYLNNASGIVVAVFFVLLVVETTAVVRRMGILNYFESIFLVIVWLVMMLLVDAVIVGTAIGWDMFGTWTYWLSNLTVLLAIMLFHKKMHIIARQGSQ
jgi:hypothetical protein